jgi:hypothetical protein
MNIVVTLSQHDQTRVMTLDRVLEGALTSVEGAEQIGLSVRQPRRLLAATGSGGWRGFRTATEAARQFML